jgi:molecular chaperone GrpE
MNDENNNSIDETVIENQTTESIDPLIECQSQREEWKDRYLRCAADFENLKKRTEKERAVWISTAQATVLQDIISIVDDFDRAFAQPVGQENAIAGFELIHKGLQKILEKYGVTSLQEVKHFDPVMHDAIMQVESPDHTHGDVVQILQKGYMHKGEVLRPAKVSVAK